MPTEKINLLADTFAKINSAYFSGDDIDIEGLSNGIALWETQKDGFLYNYIQSMLKQNDKNNQSIILDLN